MCESQWVIIYITPQSYCIISHNDPTTQHLILHYKSTNKKLTDVHRFLNDFYWYGGKRSKPGRPTKRFQKQLDVTNAYMKNYLRWEGNDQEDPTESENDLEELTESEITASTLPESMIEDATVQEYITY